MSGALAAPPPAPGSIAAPPGAVGQARESVLRPPLLDRPTVPSAPAVVIVKPGDCLWSIAARRLGPGASATQIEGEWRRWYAANRAVIGIDPNLILPGQRLVAPS
jgi:nucleoid-associated protein YgaU